MSVNSSSASDASLLSSPSINMFSFTFSCLTSTAGTFSLITFAITGILIILPLCIFVLYLGLQQWRQQRSNMTMSHSDVFTYNMVITEVMSISGSILTCCGIHTGLPQMTTVGIYFCNLNISAQTLFHILTCVERYLAVVHPITYLSLRKAKGIRIRNITICCVWLLCFAGTGLLSMEDQPLTAICCFIFLAITFIVVSFCSLSVLCVLIRPKPGERGGGRQQVDQSKLRAFYTIMAIMGVLLFRFGGTVITATLHSTLQMGKTVMCGLSLSAVWLCLPSSLVLPLLFLQRAGKLLCCKNNSESG